MNTFFTIIIIGVSLSMDAFSLALIYGTYGMDIKNKILLSVIVGIFHFVMPLIGLFFGNIIFNYYMFNVNLLMGIIFSIIGIEMIVSSFGDGDKKVFLSIMGYLLFGLSVSIDSLTTGIGLGAIGDNYIQVSGTFMVISGLFTYIGLSFGNKLSDKFGKYSTIVGGGILIILAITYLFK